MLKHLKTVLPVTAKNGFLKVPFHLNSAQHFQGLVHVFTLNTTSPDPSSMGWNSGTTVAQVNGQ